jgi:tetratricopeptide (TPR) repeat protein
VKLVERRDIIPISIMNNTDALLLFQKKLDESESRQDLEELANLLEYMPLAIVQAAAYIQQKRERYSIRRYIDAFKKSEQQQTGLLKHEAGELRRDEDAKNSIITTWQISFDDIREKWPMSADLLSLMSYFDRQGIPEAVLKVQSWEEKLQDTIIERNDSGGDNGKEKDEDVENNGVSEISSDDRFEDALDHLLSYSLVSIGQEKRTLIMHGLVQLATRKWLEMRGKQERWKAQFCTKLNLVLPNGNHENWDSCEILFPHAKSAERQRPEGRSVQDWAQILRKAAWYAWAKGDYVEAERMCKKSVGALREALDGEEVETSYSLGMLALIYSYQGQWTEAEKMEVQVMETRKRVLGDEHPDTLTSMANLASTYRNQGRWIEAEKIEVQVMETSRRVLGDEHPDTLTSMNNLAFTMKEQGRNEGAIQLMAECVQLRERVLGPGHPHALSSSAALAGWCHTGSSEELLILGDRTTGR